MIVGICPSQNIYFVVASYHLYVESFPCKDFYVSGNRLDLLLYYGLQNSIYSWCGSGDL